MGSSVQQQFNEFLPCFFGICKKESPCGRGARKADHNKEAKVEYNEEGGNIQTSHKHSLSIEDSCLRFHHDNIPEISLIHGIN